MGQGQSRTMVCIWARVSPGSYCVYKLGLAPPRSLHMDKTRSRAMLFAWLRVSLDLHCVDGLGLVLSHTVRMGQAWLYNLDPDLSKF